MKNLRDYYGDITYIRYDGKLTGSFNALMDKGVIPLPLDEKDLEFMSAYPNIIERLMEGETLYINDLGEVYLGRFISESSDRENPIFLATYDSMDGDMAYGLREVDNGIANSKPANVKRLTKIGDSYRYLS